MHPQFNRRLAQFGSLTCYSLLSATLLSAPLSYALSSSSSSSGSSSGLSSSNSSGYFYGFGSSSSSSGGGTPAGSCTTEILFNHDSSSASAGGHIEEGDCTQPGEPQSLVDRYSFTLEPGQQIGFKHNFGNSPVHLKVLDAQGVTRSEASGLGLACPAKGAMLALGAGTYTLEVSFVDPTERGYYFIHTVTSNPDPAYIDQETLAAKCSAIWPLTPTDEDLFFPITCSSGSLGTNHFTNISRLICLSSPTLHWNL